MKPDGQNVLSTLGVLGFAVGAVVLAADGQPVLAALLALSALVLMTVVMHRW